VERSVRGRRRDGRAVPAVIAALALLLVAGAPQPAMAAAPAAGPPSTQAPSAIIIDRVTGRVLYGKDIHHERPMASTTKIMTALLVVQRAPYLSRTITAPAAVSSTSGIGLRPGEHITIRQALLGLMLKSAQDCGLTLATAMAGSEPAFVDWMNAKARTLRLDDTHYENSTGSYRDASHHSSVSDLAVLARLAMRNARFRDIVWRQHATVRWGHDRELLVRANNLLLHWDWADGIKCGYTGAAGFCLVGSGQPGLRPFITATLGAPERDQEARDHVAMFEWASSLYETKTVVTKGDLVATVPLAGGGEVQVAARTTLTAVVRSAAAVRYALTLPVRFAMRPADGTVVGKVVYRADGVELGTVKLVVVTPAPPESPESPAPVRADASAAPGDAASPAPAED
jgi:D-alanyl-D-alanine carboxypeptidase (penicillin-binding protein 5/6)